MPFMLPCLAFLDAGLEWSIVPQNHRHVLGLDLFGGRTHIRSTRWEIKARPGEHEVCAILHVEIHSAFIPKVWFGHLTLAKFTVPNNAWDYDRLSPATKAALAEIGRRMSHLLNWSPIRYPDVSAPSSFLWNRRLQFAWAKVALILNFHHPLHQTLHNLRSMLRSAIPSAHILERGVFHISFDGIVQFEVATPGSGYLGWSLVELDRVFTFNCSFGVYSELGDGRLL